MKIFSWKQDVKDGHENPLEVAWQALAQGITAIFTNHKKDQFATRVPISGGIDDKKIGTRRAIVNVPHNAFVKPYTRNWKICAPRRATNKRDWREQGNGLNQRLFQGKPVAKVIWSFTGYRRG